MPETPDPEEVRVHTSSLHGGCTVILRQDTMPSSWHAEKMAPHARQNWSWYG